MIKRISCRVVSSVALAKSSSEPLHIDKLSTSHSGLHHQTHISSLGHSTYAGRTNVPQASLDDAPTGLILDCYA